MKQQFLFCILLKLACKTFALFNVLPVFAKYQAIYEELESTSKRDDVRSFVSTVLNTALESSQICFITDSIYGNEIYQSSLTDSLDGRPIYISNVIDEESFEHEPSQKTAAMLSAMRVQKCDYYVILITNGIQMLDFLKYADHRRLLNSRANFIMLHDYRLFVRRTNFIWKRIINVVFIRRLDSQKHKKWYELSTVPFPASIRSDVFVSRVLNYFIPPKRYLKRVGLFNERKSHNLHANTLNVVLYPHSPAVIRAFNENYTAGNYSGLEIDLIEVIAEKMNFRVNFFETENNELERWGERISEENYTGLLNVMNEARADIALADLFQTMYHSRVMDLTVPYTIECLTFITPEVLSDNSWQALTAPFSLGMWIGTLLSLALIILIFYAFSNCYRVIRDESAEMNDIFDSVSACAICAYSMILLVSIPKLPDRWSVRLLTGWWWLYCVLVVVAYRASLTSILANPQPRLTIDSLRMLANSKLTCGVWGEQNKNFFLKSSDPVLAEKIVRKLEEIDVPEDGIAKVEKGDFAYFESTIELRRLRLEHERKQNNKLLQKLHIMEECAINMPISIGLDKNSPLKTQFDELIRFATEAGLINKWLGDAIKSFESSVEEPPAEALMDLKKFYGALVALLCGYIISVLAFGFEITYWTYFVKRHPNYDKYYGRVISDWQLESRKIASRREMRRQKCVLKGRPPNGHSFAISVSVGQ